MDTVILTEIEVRVLGALAEKAITTPDYYPLTLNALVNACNQTSNRDPVVNFGEQAVERALDSLREKRLAFVFSGADARVPKYGQKLAQTFELLPPEVAVLTVLLLRGPQTAGEIRSRSGRLHEFARLDEVESTLQGLANKTSPPLVVRLPRQTGFKEVRYAHLLAGEVKLTPPPSPGPRPEPFPLPVRGENDPVVLLQAEIAGLRRELIDLQRQFADFRKQFE